ncbi:unnamed protein product [Caretta caretta]
MAEPGSWAASPLQASGTRWRREAWALDCPGQGPDRPCGQGEALCVDRPDPAWAGTCAGFCAGPVDTPDPVVWTGSQPLWAFSILEVPEWQRDIPFQATGGKPARECVQRAYWLESKRSCCRCGFEGFPLHTRRTPEPDKEEKERIRNDVFSEIQQANVASDSEHRAWRMNTEGSLEKERVEKRKAQESQQEKEREIHQDVMGLVRQKTQMLQSLVELQVQPSWARLLLQPIKNSVSGPSCTSLNVLHGIRGHCTIRAT